MNAGARLLLRRRRWGRDERAVARRARRLFGSPFVYYWLRTRGLRVTPVGDENVRGEWLARADADESVVIYLHGGGYVSCSPRTHRPLTAALARLTRARVFALDYRVAPEHRFPAALDDAVACYRWLLGQGVPAGAVSVAGDSAGGGLVLGLLLRARDEGLAPPACGVCFSPWTDLSGGGPSVRLNDGRCSMFRTENIAEFAAVYLGGASPLDPYASPAHADLKGLPPLLLQVGSTELLLDDTRLVHRKIQEAGGVSRLETYDDVVHGWHMLEGIVPESGSALRRAAAFIRKHVSDDSNVSDGGDGLARGL